VARRKPEKSPSGQPPLTIDDLANRLRKVVRAGVDMAEPDERLAALRCVHERARSFPDESEDGVTLAWREVVRAAVAALDDGPRSQATRHLLGVHPDTRGYPLRERRRSAAYQLDVLPGTLQRNYEAGLLREVAAEIYRMEHAPSPQPEGRGEAAGAIVAASALDGTGVDASPGAPTARSEALTSRSRGWPWVLWARRRHRTGGHGPGDSEAELPGGLVASDQSSVVPPARQLYRELREIRDQYARREWIVIFAIGGVVVGVRYGLDAVPRYLAILALFGLASTVVEIVLAWRAERGSAIYERWPKIVLLSLTGALAVGFDINDSDDGRPGTVAGSCQLSPGDPGCPSTSTTATTVEVPNRVPTTFAVPNEPTEPECPPDGSTERRLSFTDVPPLCIRRDATYVAEVATNYGDFELTLNSADALYTVNNFVFLARWRFYDGTTLTPFPQPVISSTYLSSSDPTEAEHDDQAPGYGLVFERHEGPYPDDTVYAVMTNPEHPNRWSLVIAQDAHDQISAGGGIYPVLGEVTACRDIVATPTGAGDLQPRQTSAPIVIDTITIREAPAGSTPSSPRQDPQCREAQAAAE
jgi:hypothetical protein